MGVPSDLWAQWNWEPSIIVGILLWSAVYAYTVGPLRRQRNLGTPVNRGQVAFFILSQLVLVFALLSPIDLLGDKYLFSAHMVQHLMLATLWPPLILLAFPSWLIRPIFQSRVAPVAGFFTAPLVAIALFNIDIYAWHLPPLYDLTLQNEQVHIVEHLSFLVVGVLNWWPLLSPVREQRLSYPFQVLYLFADGMFMMVLGILFTFAPMAFYAPYVSAPRLWGISPVSDQQLGGLIMWYPGNVPYGIWLVIAFYRWFDLNESEPEGPAFQSPTIGPPVH